MRPNLLFAATVLAATVAACTPAVGHVETSTPAATAKPEFEPDANPTAEPSSDPLLGFRHRGQPIHPDAVARVVPLEPSIKAPVTVDLTAYAGVDAAVEHDGATVRFDDDEPGWSSYEVHQRQGTQFLLEVWQNGGGTGMFSTAVVVELRADQLVSVFEVPTGDRCNGSIVDAPRLDGEGVLLSYWLTPYDLVALSTRDVSHITPYEDLENSAMSCIGHALVRVEPKRAPTLIGVSLAPGLDGRWHADQAGWTENYPLQPRFNRIYAKWIAAGQVELDSAAIDACDDELLIE